ncbi:MAG: hypothetical protein JOZ64_08250 [Solirubrobacterales bacterium]|nr:hypothetical protein [Solirubrobacterales bacterium]
MCERLQREHAGELERLMLDPRVTFERSEASGTIAVESSQAVKPDRAGDAWSRASHMPKP